MADGPCDGHMTFRNMQFDNLLRSTERLSTSS